MGLKGQQVITTRQSLGPDQLTELLTSHGALVTSVPTIVLDDPPDWAPFDKGALHLSQMDWALFTSANAVWQTTKRLASLNLQWPSSLKIAAVGQKTAEAALKEGWPVEAIPKNFQAEGLLELFEALGASGQRFFFPRALEAREMLVEGLEALGAEIILAPCYQNRVALENRQALRDALKLGSMDWITFTSASTAKHLVEILGEIPQNLPKIASIGQITSTALRQLGLEPKVQADPQTLVGLVEAMENYQ